MSNEQQKPVAEASLPRKSTITVGINRSLNTAQYENLQIKVETTDEIVWSSLEERNKKIDNLVMLLNRKYADTQKAVLADLGVEEKRAWMKQGATLPTVKNNSDGADALLKGKASSKKSGDLGDDLLA